MQLTFYILQHIVRLINHDTFGLKRGAGIKRD